MTTYTGINVPLIGSRHPDPHMNGLITSYLSTTTLTLSAGSCSDASNTIDMTLAAAITLNSAIVGAGGMDTGTLAASTFYYIHVVGSSSKSVNPSASAVISLSKTAPALPYGYDASRLVGTVLTDSSSHFLKARITGNGSDRVLTFENSIQITLPASGSFPTTYTALSLEPAVAPIDAVSNIQIEANMSAAAAADRLWLSTEGTHYASVLSCPVITVVTYADMGCQSLLAANVPTIYYKLDNASETAVTIYVKAFSFTV